MANQSPDFLAATALKEPPQADMFEKGVYRTLTVLGTAITLPVALLQEGYAWSLRRLMEPQRHGRRTQK